MTGTGGRRAPAIAPLFVGVAAGLGGSSLVLLALLDLGVLFPSESYGGAVPPAVSIVLGVGAGLVLGGPLVVAAYRSLTAAGMLGSLVLTVFGMFVVLTACGPYGAAPSPCCVPIPLCNPAGALEGIALSALGADGLGYGLLRLRRLRTR